MTRPTFGFTLIEVMITIAIVSILVIAALPNYSLWIQNSRIRTAADALLNGLQLARAEAVQRNALVVFSVTSGTGWTVTNVGNIIQSRPAGEGSRNVALTVTPPGATSISFNGLGRVRPNADLSLSLATLNITAASGAANARALTISIASGIRLCDGDSTLGAGDPRRC